jgi:hypothetical protein
MLNHLVRSHFFGEFGIYEIIARSSSEALLLCSDKEYSRPFKLNKTILNDMKIAESLGQMTISENIEKHLNKPITWTWLEIGGSICTKFVPNTSLFRAMYPDGVEFGNKLRVMK